MCETSLRGSPEVCPRRYLAQAPRHGSPPQPHRPPPPPPVRATQPPQARRGGARCAPESPRRGLAASRRQPPALRRGDEYRVHTHGRGWAVGRRAQRRASPSRPRPQPSAPLSPPPPPPARLRGGGHEAAAVYKKPPGRERRDHRAASAAGGPRQTTGSDTMAQSVWGYDSDNGEKGRGGSLGLKRPGGSPEGSSGAGGHRPAASRGLAGRCWRPALVFPPRTRALA